jgi:hypothetical protein
MQVVSVYAHPLHSHGRLPCENCLSYTKITRYIFWRLHVGANCAGMGVNADGTVWSALLARHHCGGGGDLHHAQRIPATSYGHRSRGHSSPEPVAWGLTPDPDSDVTPTPNYALFVPLRLMCLASVCQHASPM